MITLYDLNDMISFGEYILSDERKEGIIGKSHKKIYGEDLQNWLKIQSNKMEDDKPETE